MRVFQLKGSPNMATVLASLVKSLRNDFITKKGKLKNIVFKSSITKILIIALFLKIMLIIHFDDFLFRDFYTLLFDLPPNSGGTPVANRCLRTERVVK
jgi:hypothetical protein